ncbi:MAG: hypothetical protein ACE5FO_04625 [Parvularculaceae bacterium]
MPYGMKRGVKAPGEFGFADMIGLALAGSAGIIAALVTDFQQSGEASALYTINQWVVAIGSMLGFTNIPLWVVAVGLIVAGAASTFYFQPITRQGAFAQGFGLLAVIMTAIPSDLAGGLEAIAHGDDLPGLEPVSLSREAALPFGGAILPAAFTPAVYSTGQARVYTVQARRAVDKYEVHLTINFPEGIPEDIDTMIRKGTIRGRLHNADTGQTWNLFRTSGGTVHREGDELHIHAGVPAQSEAATLWVRVECASYGIEVQSADARLGETLYWTIDMQPSGTPLFLQRLNKSYWF